MRKIGLFTPISSSIFDKMAAERCARIHLPNDVEIECRSLKKGPISIETIFDEDHASAALYEEIVLQRDRIRHEMAALVINCFADPGVDGLRELLDIPVIGVGQASFALAMQLAPKFSILSIQKNSVPHAWQRLSKYGIERRVASVYGIEMPAVDLEKDKELALSYLIKYSEKAICEDGADGIVLGCTGMADLADLLQDRIKVPVVEPTSAGVWMAIVLTNLKLSHGRFWMYQKADPEKLR